MNTRFALTCALMMAAPLGASAQLPPVRPVVTFSYHHHSTSGTPEWVLIGPTRAPARHRELQPFRPNGCTVTGQARVLIGDEQPARRRFTFVGESVVEGVARQRATLGIDGVGGVEWYEAFAVPPAVAATVTGHDVVAFDGRVRGISVAGASAPSQRAEAGRFAGCGQGPVRLAPDRDGFLRCFPAAVVTSTWSTRSAPGLARLESYRTTVHSTGSAQTRRELRGRFVRLLAGRAGAILIVHDAHEFRAHTLP